MHYREIHAWSRNACLDYACWPIPSLTVQIYIQGVEFTDIYLILLNWKEQPSLCTDFLFEQKREHIKHIRQMETQFLPQGIYNVFQTAHSILSLVLKLATVS